MDGERTSRLTPKDKEARLIPTDKQAWCGTALLIASATLGGGVGWFVGQSGSDAMVLSAVLPMVLTGGGFLVLLRAAALSDFAQYIILILSMIFFVITLVIGSLVGNANRLNSEEERRKKELNRSIEFRIKFLEQCSADEYRINELRKRLLNLPPLSSEVFCGSQRPAKLVPHRTPRSMAP